MIKSDFSKYKNNCLITIGQSSNSWSLIYRCLLNLSRINYRALAAHLPPENSLWPERLCINCHKLLQLTQSSKLIIIFGLVKAAKWPVWEYLHLQLWRGYEHQISGTGAPPFQDSLGHSTVRCNYTIAW